MAVPGGGAPMGPGYSPTPRIRFDVIGEAWKLFQQQMGTWIVSVLIAGIGIFVAYFIVSLIIGLVFGAVGGAAGRVSSAAGSGIIIMSMLVNLVLSALLMVAILALTGGLYRMALKQVRGEPIAIGDIFSVTDVIGSLILASLLVGVCVFIGEMLCFIPGLIAAGLLMFTIPLVVDKRMAAMDALRTSYQTLMPELLMATLFYIVISIVGSIGAIACGIGMIFTLPLMPLSIALLYRDFFDTTAAPAATGPYTPPMPPTGGVPPTV